MKLALQSALVILSLFAAAQSNATPAIGDRSVFNVNLSSGGQSMDGVVTFELTAFEKTTDAWTQTTITEFNGQKDTQTTTTSTHDLLTDAMIDEALANCAAKGGTSEVIATPAGAFDSCAVPVSSSDGHGTIWIAKVPFGYAKWVAYRNDGVVINGLLQSFVNGK